MIIHGIDNVGVLLPHDRPVKKGGRMAEPTAAQRKMFAKMGIAMPDGSYYIRNAAELSDAIKSVGRGGADHDTIRVHIIKRAAALHLSNSIPDNWNPNGSMKQSDEEWERDFLAHFGVKGMHWGVRNSDQKSAALIGKAVEHEKKAAVHVTLAATYAHAHADLLKNGTDSHTFKTAYGTKGQTQGEWAFYARTGLSKQQALEQTAIGLRQFHNIHVKTANKHAEKAQKLREREAALHGKKYTPGPRKVVTFAPHSALDENQEDVLLHFGIKGMHWGVRNVNPGSADHQRAQQVGHIIKTGGVKSATNQDLQDLVTRLNLEQQHARLTATPSRVDRGHAFVRKTIGISKTGVDAVRTGQRVYGVAKDAKGAYDHYQRGKPLKVVRIGQ